MKKTLIFLSFFCFFATSILSAADSVAVFPVGAKTRSEWTVAKEVDKSISDSFNKISIEAVGFKELLSVNDRKALNKCREDLRCHQDISKKASKKVDFFLFTRLKLGKRIVINTYLFDRKYNRLESAQIDFDEFAEADDIANGIVNYWNRFFKKHAVSTVRSKKQEAKKEKYDDSGFEDDEDDSYKRSSRVDSVESIISSGFSSYATGNLKDAESSFGKAASMDVVGKKLYNDVQEVTKFLARGNAAIKAKNYEEAAVLIAKAEKANEEIVGLGIKYRAYSKDSVERVSYLEPTTKDIQVVDVIHKKYAKMTEKSRKERIASLAETDKWLNTRIVERENKLKQFEADSKSAIELEKKEYGELAKKIKELKYQWEKDDSELEQKIVALENKLTLFEQREKGVVKVGINNEDEKKRADELSESDKKYGDMLKKLHNEKEVFYANHKKELEDGSKRTEVAVVKLEEKKKANDDAIAEIDKKINAETEKFEAVERTFADGNEKIKMKNEDEDRKFKVEVEKEYQAKFDELNKKLQDFDQNESEKQKELGKYDREIEEYMTKNVETMSKFQDELEKDRNAVDAEFKTKKENATAEAEKKHSEDLAKLTAEKTDLEAKIAEGETPPLKKQLAAVEKKIAAHESGKEDFIAEKVMKVDMEYEAKTMEIDTKLAKKNDELQKDNNKFRTAKLAEKKKSEGDFKSFQNRKDMFKKTIDNQILAAQKERDKKIENRQKEREKLSGTWDSAKEKRMKDLDRKLKVDKDKKDRLTAENEKLSIQVTDVNNKWGQASEDLKVKHQEAAEKFDKSWNERFEKTKEEQKAGKDAVEVKYAEKQVSEKEAQKQQKTKWEEEIQSLNEEKQRRKDERAKLLEDEKVKWATKKTQWVEEEKQRKIDKAQFIKDMKKENDEDRKEASRKRKEADAKFEENTKDIYAKEIDEISKKFKEEYRITRTREVTGVKTQSNISTMKADALAKNGLIKLQEKDLLGARRAFAESLFLDKSNQIALDGMKSINITAKSMYWEAFGMRETNKAKAKEIFTVLTKTLMPSNEFFVKSRVALEDL